MATNYQAFFRLNGSSEWNGNPSANPTTLVGGVDLSAMIGTPMMPTVQGSGDGQITCNFGATGFLGAVPTGYMAGWPSASSGFTTLDSARRYGSASLSGGNLIASFPTVAGMVQATDAYTSGAYYFEVTYSGGDIFTVDMGGGVGANFSSGGSFSFWFTGAFNSGDPNGGALINAGTLFGRNVNLGTIFSFPKFATFGVAVFLSPNAPPQPPIVPQPIPNSLQRWRGQVGLNWKGMALVGDAFTNVVGLSDFTNFTEYGNSMQFLITTPPIHDDRKRIFMPRFEIEVECGDGIPDNPETPPVMMLEWSKDGGVTWSTLQPPRSMGLIGQYIKRLRWLNLGNSRTWVFRLTCTDNVRRYVIGAYTTDYKSLG